MIVAKEAVLTPIPANIVTYPGPLEQEGRGGICSPPTPSQKKQSFLAMYSFFQKAF